ncbi:MAG: fibronectin type III domain-containing protein, partial [Bacteroidota bacterium]
PKGTKYEYLMMATDLGGLQSSSKVLHGNILEDYIRKPVGSISSSVDRRAKTVNLRWAYTPEEGDLKYFEVWRGLEGENPVSIARVTTPPVAEGRKKPTFRFQDEGPLKMNTTYVYRVKAVYTNGAASPLSAPEVVNY